MGAGRPVKYKTAEELEDLINEYFDSKVPEYVFGPDGKLVTNSKGTPIIKANPPTITGLALHLGFNSRGTIYEYEKKNDEFSDAIKKARLRCECYAEEMMLSGSCHPAGPIFALKNYGWSDQQEIKHSGQVTIVDDIK